MSGNSFSCNEWISLLPETDNPEQVILQILRRAFRVLSMSEGTSHDISIIIADRAALRRPTPECMNTDDF
jgi:hypothetical protein